MTPSRSLRHRQLPAGAVATTEPDAGRPAARTPAGTTRPGTTRPGTTRPRWAARVLGVAVALVLVRSGAAFAHVEPEPASVPAGRPVTVGFTIGHGCDGSPTVQVRFAIPAGLVDVAGVPKAGWVVDNRPATVTFSGGELPANTPDRFELSFTATGSARTVSFPLVQTCRTGELAWISVAEPGRPEPDHPAPQLEITGSAPAAISVAVPAQSSTTIQATTAPTGPGPGAGATVPTTAPAPAPTTAKDTGTAASGEGGRSAATWIAVAALVAAVVAGTTVVLRRRR